MKYWMYTIIKANCHRRFCSFFLFFNGFGCSMFYAYAYKALPFFFPLRSLKFVCAFLHFFFVSHICVLISRIKSRISLLTIQKWINKSQWAKCDRWNVIISCQKCHSLKTSNHNSLYFVYFNGIHLHTTCVRIGHGRRSEKIEKHISHAHTTMSNNNNILILQDFLGCL